MLLFKSSPIFVLGHGRSARQLAKGLFMAYVFKQCIRIPNKARLNTALEVNQQNVRPFFLMSYKILKKYFCSLATLIYVKIKRLHMMCTKQ